jgi:hypothetical protein
LRNIVTMKLLLGAAGVDGEQVGLVIRPGRSVERWSRRNLDNGSFGSQQAAAVVHLGPDAVGAVAQVEHRLVFAGQPVQLERDLGQPPCRRGSLGLLLTCGRLPVEFGPSPKRPLVPLGRCPRRRSLRLRRVDPGRLSVQLQPGLFDLEAVVLVSRGEP